MRGRGVFHNILIKYAVSGGAVPFISSGARNLVLINNKISPHFVRRNDKLPDSSFMSAKLLSGFRGKMINTRRRLHRIWKIFPFEPECDIHKTD